MPRSVARSFLCPNAHILMPITRRDLLKAGVLVAAATTVPRPLLADIGAEPEPVPPIDDPRLKALVARALDAARTAGGTYADVRLTYTRERSQDSRFGHLAEELAVGVRALVNGYWGFASGPVWSPDEMARLGREAVHQAKASALGKSREVDLAPAPAVREGHWRMPVEIDPFELHPSEMMDRLSAMRLVVHYSSPGFTVRANSAVFVRQEKAFGSTTGSYCTQRLYRSRGRFSVHAGKAGRIADGSLDLLTPAGIGWELYREQPLKEAIRQLIEELEEDLAFPVKPVDVGRYDTVLDAHSVANLLDGTLGRATELDRALGYEANAGGTSYLDDPFAMLGTYQAGAPLLTVTGNRSEPGGCATVQWDDEGIAPDAFPLVQDGVLVDFQTTRESAGWLKESYAKASKPFRSHGCAAAPTGLFAPLQHPPNLVVTPGREAHDFDALVSGVASGIAVKGATLDMDFQGSSGLGTGRVYEIKNGKRVAALNTAGFLFRATDLWKGLLALGGAASQRRYGMLTKKGEPPQEHYHSVTAVPAVFKQLTVIDVMRKA